MGRLRVSEGAREYYCTATLVGANVILTAAHCIIDQDSNSLLDDVTFTPNRISGEPHEEFAVVGALGFTGAESYLYYGEHDWIYLFTSESIGLRYGWMRVAEAPPYDAAGAFVGSVSGYATHAMCDLGSSLCEGLGNVQFRSTFEGEYVINTAGGTSGGPIVHTLSDGEVVLTGVHSRGNTVIGRNIGVMANAFRPFLQDAKARVFASQETQAHVVEGVVCNAHEHCDASSYCADLRGGRCFRCDVCGVAGRVAGGADAFSVGTFDGGDCPTQCFASSETAASLDVDSDCGIADLLGAAAGAFAASICFESSDVCLDKDTCEATESLPESADERDYIGVLGAYVPQRFGDSFQVEDKVLLSYSDGAAGLAKARGYASGVLNVDGAVVGFGAARLPVFPEVSTEEGSISIPADPVNGAIFLAGAFLVVPASLVVYVRKKRHLVKESNNNLQLKT